MLSEVQSKCGVRGRTEHHERESTTNRNENPKEGRLRPQGRRADGLTSTPRQWPSWEKRGGWGKVTMISRGVEISIAGDGGEMLRGLSLGHFFFFVFSFFFFVIKSLLCLKVQKTHAALAMEIKNL